ncbi:carbohydrate ABC transporter permease [Nakamurella endophytica]|uniref:carbohydrate ABC transporter permease n=1 Tax=Nakamurella endophytica TaxID=1748367 RepID=UPI001E5B9538|nr:sugar ABC transporter permease [Nakamurella endophytica]
MTQTLTRPTEPAHVRKEPAGNNWITWLVGAILGVIIVALVWIGWKAFTGTKILFDSTKSHGWFLNMLFNPTSAVQKIIVMVLAIALFVGVMALILFLVDRERVPNGTLVLGFLGPVIVAVSVGLVWPAVKTIFQSFRKFDQFGRDLGWNGFHNYGYILSIGKGDLIINTVLWVFLVPIFATVFGLVYAVLVDRTRFEAAAKALIFLPTAISMVAASIIWRYVYYAPAPSGQPQVGLANAVVTAFGGSPSNWTLKFPQATFAMIVVMIWIQAGFAMTTLSAAIKAVPDDIIEAARIDGASGMRLFRSVTVPTIRPTLVVVITTVAIASLKTFDIVNVMGGNLPNNDILANAFYRQITVSQPGFAGASAVLIFVIVLPVIVFNVRQMKKSEGIR